MSICISNNTKIQPIFKGITDSQFITSYRNPKSNYIKSEKNQYTLALLNRQSPFNIDKLRLEENKSYMNQIIANVQAIPSIPIPTCNLDDSVFDAQSIPILDDDSKGLKQDIRRFNREIAKWTCDHSDIHSKQVLYQRDLIRLMESPKYKQINKYLKDMGSACYEIKGKDENGLDFLYDHPVDVILDDDEDTYEDDGYDNIRISEHKAEEIVNIAISFKADILEVQAKYERTHCPICEQRKRRYENMIDEVEERRRSDKLEYEKQIKAIQDSVDENMDDFMNQYFPNKDNLKLMDIVKMWKLVKKEMITQDEMGGLLEETEHWKITNSHNIKRAKKI